MNPLFFRKQIDRLIEEFSPKSFGPGKVALIEDAVRDLSDQEFLKIVNHFLGQRQAPIPNDFREAARRERVARPRQEFGPPPEYVPRCRECLDVGIVAMVRPELAVLGKCHCPQGNWQPWNLPIARAIPGYQVTPLPWEMFKPLIPRYRAVRRADDAKIVELATMREIWKKVEWWREKMRISEEYWANNQDDLPPAG